MDESDDNVLALALAKLCWLLRMRQQKGTATLPLFERVMLLHITMLFRIWMWGAKR